MVHGRIQKDYVKGSQTVIIFAEFMAGDDGETRLGNAQTLQ